MRKECRALCGLFVVLIVFCVTSPVVGQQSNTGSTVLQYTKTIDAEKLMKNIEDLTISVDKLPCFCPIQCGNHTVRHKPTHPLRK